MKRLIPVLLLFLVGFVVFLFIRSGSQPLGAGDPSLTRHGQYPQPAGSDNLISDDKRSASRVIGGVTEKGKLIHEKPAIGSEQEKDDGFVKKVITSKWLDKNENKAGRRRVRIVEADFKYPNIRLEEEVWTDPQTGEITVNRLLASVADHVMVGLKKGADELAASKALEKNGYRVRSIEPGSYILAELANFQAVDDQQISIDDIEALEEFIDYAEPDYLVYPSVVPNDPDFSGRKLWGLDNPGTVAGTTADADIDAPEAWTIRTDASNVIVAVTDTGIQYNHEDLAPNMWSNNLGEHGLDAYGNDNDPMDIGGHGTHCAGTIGARGNNGIGLTGVAWNVQLMGGRFLGPQGGTTSDGIRVVNYARINGAHIISASWGGGGFSQGLYNAIKAAGDAGIPFIAAAGNDALNNDSTPHYPSSYDLPTLVAVASTTSQDKLSYFSCYGRYSVDIGAPGSDIWSSYIGSNSSYKHLNGTSMATPHVSGAMALARAHFPDDDAEDLIARLYSSVDHIPALAGKVSTGGRLNLQKLLGASTTGVNNDDFENALRFESDYGYWSGSNKKATREDDEDTFSLPNTGNRSVWFAWKAPFRGMVEFRVEATDVPIRVIAFKGDQKGALTIAADGGSIVPSRNQTLRFYCQQDQEYRILVDSSHTTGQNLLTTLALLPVNDAFGSALGLSGDRFLAKGSNRNATAEQFETNAPHAGVGKGKSVWWKWTPDFDGDFVITTQESEFDTVLAIYTGSDPNNLTEVASNDDRNALDWSSQVTFNVTSGTEYYIAVDGYRGDAAGGIVLNGFKSGQLIILKQPESKLVRLGRTVDFEVIASGASNLSYRWFKDSQPIPGAQSSILKIGNVLANDFGAYHVAVSDGQTNLQSESITLSELREAPAFVWVPSSISRAAGQSLTLAPRVTGSAALAYQWFKNGILMPGENSPSLNFASTQESDSGRYKLTVTNDLGTADSGGIDVNVLSIPWSDWSWRFPDPQGFTLNDVAIDNGDVVAVGEGGMIMTSSGGEKWQIRGLGDSSYRFKRVIRADGYWLACDYAGNFAKSSDLQIWTKYKVSEFGPYNTLANLFSWKGKLYYFRYSGGDSTLYQSTNGVSWSTVKIFAGKQYNAPLTSATTLVIVERNSNNVLSTTDVINWTTTTTDPGEGTPIYQGTGLFSAHYNQFMIWSEVYGKSRLWTSPDGLTWSYSDYDRYTFWQGSPYYDTNPAYRIVEQQGQFYFHKAGQRYLLTSTDGITWTKQNFNAEINAFNADNGKLALVSSNGDVSVADKVANLYIEEPDSYGSTEYFAGLKKLDNRAWAYSTERRLFSSSDGTQWRNEGLLVGSSPALHTIHAHYLDASSLIYANGSYWCGQTNSSEALKIFKGIHPSAMVEQVDSNLTYIKSLAFHDGRFVAVANSGIHYSDNGIVWTQATSPVSGYINYRAVSSVNGKFIIVDDSGRIYFSSNGVSWVYHQTNRSAVFGNIRFAYALNQYVVILPDSSIWRSSNGISWTQINISSYLNNSSDPVSAVAGDGNAVVFYARNRAIYSENFSQWYTFDISTTGVSDAFVLADSIVATGSGSGVSTSLHLFQGGSPRSYAPVARFANITNGGRYLVNSQMTIKTEVFDPEGEVVNTKLYINGMEVGAFTANNPTFDWYPTEVGEYSFRLVAGDVSGVFEEQTVDVTVDSAAVIGKEINLSNASQINLLGGRFYLTGKGGKLGVLNNDLSVNDIILPSTADLSSIQYHEGVYVVGGDEVFTSLNGITWNYIPDVVGDVELDNGKFIVRKKNSSKNFWVSEDGLEWKNVTFTTIFTNGYVSQVMYDFDRYWVVSRNKVYVSENDGKTWLETDVEASELTRVQSTIYAIYSDTLSKTSDGISWSKQTLAESVSKLHYSGGMFFAGKSRGHVSNMNDFDLALISVDGVAWQPVTGAGSYHDISYGNNQWVMFGSTAAYRSSDGLHWDFILGNESGVSPVDAPPHERPLGALSWKVDYHADYGFVALGSGWYDYLHATSPDGVIWDYKVGQSKQSATWSSIAIKDGRACTLKSGKIEWSDDLVTWSAPANHPPQQFQNLQVVNGVFVCMSTTGMAGFSNDGENWTFKLIEQGAWLKKIAYSNGQYAILAAPRLWVAVDRLYVSADLENWSKENTPDSYSNITSGVDEFILSGKGLKIARSADAVTWIETTLTSSDTGLYSITAATAGAGGYLLTYGNKSAFSTDLISWTTTVFPSTTTIHDLFYDPTMGFQVLGAGELHSSLDGVSWNEPRPVVVGASHLMIDGTDTYVATGSSLQILTDRDIELVSVTAPVDDYGVGDDVAIQLVLKNHTNKTVSLDIVTFDLLLSKDGVLGNSDDIQIANNIPLNQIIQDSEILTVPLNVKLPSTIVAGSYYIAARVVSSESYREFNNANNLKFSDIKPLNIQEWVLNLNTNGNGQINQDFSAVRYPHGARVSLTANAGKGAAFAGWGGDALGAENQITILMNGNKSVQANFSSRASLQVHVRGAGEVTGLADLGSYTIGETASITATPANGWVFSGWSGATGGNTTTANITMDTNKVVTATFTKLKATWKSEHFTQAELLDDSVSGDDADPDGDGLRNWQEYLHLSDPNDKTSRGVIELKVDGGFLYAIFTRNSGVGGGLSLACQGSRNMSDWDAPDIQERVLSTVDGVETVEARIPADGNQQGYLRLKYQR